jgi:hypothetical protein
MKISTTAEVVLGEGISLGFLYFDGIVFHQHFLIASSDA